MSGPEQVIATLVALAVLVAVAGAVLRLFGAPHPWAPAWAVLRGALQLAAISLILAGVITSPLWVGVALLVMFTVASLTAVHRLGGGLRRTGVVVTAMGAGILATLVVVFGTRAIEFSPRYALAIGGIVIGNAMTIAVLTGRRLTESTHEHWDEVEGWLALGATPRRSTQRLARGAVYSALIPSTDQTKTTGLVTLPGAFVGAIFGGLSPVQAGMFQIVVLAAIMAAGSVTAVIIASLLGPVRQRPPLLR
jgi:putative ABC transport system permease protein